MTDNFLEYVGFLCIVLFVLLVPISCTEEEPVLSRANKIQADSIFREREKVVINEVDSLCQLAYNKAFERAKDSIAGIRLREIEEINSR